MDLDRAVGMGMLKIPARGETKAREIGSNFLTCVGGVKCVVVGCVGLRKMMCRRFVAWCEHFGSASARAPQKGRYNTCVGRAGARADPNVRRRSSQTCSPYT